MGGAEAALAAPASGRSAEWAAEVGSAARSLKEALDIHVQITEDPEGILDEIVRMAPRLSGPVARLRKDHVELCSMVEEEIATFAMSPASPDADWVSERRDAMTELLARIARHRQHGADLTYEAYGVDIGGET